MGIKALHHVQLAMPSGGEDQARAFYEGVLGIPEVPKPRNLANRGGCWFERGPVKVHLGVEPDFRPARKAHPAFLVEDLETVKTVIEAAGYTLKSDEPLEGYNRVYVDDPFRNRIELIESRSTFVRYIGIDYSGARTPTSSLKGLRIYMADRASAPVEIQPPLSPRKYWTRHGIAEWLVERLSEDAPTLVGIDHGFSFPVQYFERHGLAHDWPSFLDDFQSHWPTHEDHSYVDFVRGGDCGNGAARAGSPRWRRLTEVRAGAAKSVFHFDVQGSVAKSTHAGLPWLRYLRHQVGRRVHFWPFDGWEIPTGRSVVAEVYPRLWSRSFAPEGRNADQHDAYSVAAWMRTADLDGSLAKFFKPSLTAAELKMAQIEGWILGLT